jgi:hypothetical protein
MSNSRPEVVLDLEESPRQHCLVLHNTTVRIITGIRGLSKEQKASLRALGAFKETSVGV